MNEQSPRELILIKHSLPEIVPEFPSKEWHLSEIGKARCEALARELARYSPDVLISSAEPKAVETAQRVASQINQPFSIFEDLHENDRTGLGFLEQEQLEATIKRFFAQPDELVIGTETARQTLARFSKAVGSIEEKHPNKNIAIVAHGTVITLFIEQFNVLDAFSFWKKLGLPSFAVLSLPDHQLKQLIERAG